MALWTVDSTSVTTDSTSATTDGASGSAGGAALASPASDITTAAAALINFASVTLVAPLYTDVGGIFDPNLVWPFNAPVVGSVVRYDPTFITILPDGEIVSTSNNCSAEIQYFDGVNVNEIDVYLMPTMVGYAGDATSASGTFISGAAVLAAAATNLTQATGALTTGILLAAAASDLTAATAALTTAIKLAAAANDATSASGAIAGTAAHLAGSATDASTASALLSTRIQLAGAAADVISATGALTTQIQLAAQASDATSATGAIRTNVLFIGNAVDSITAAGLLGSLQVLQAAANDVTLASGALFTKILLAGSAADSTTGSGSLSTSIRMAGAALSSTSAAATLTTNQSPAGLWPIDPRFTIAGKNEFMTPRFPSIGPTEERVLTFNFGDDLVNGELLTGIISVSIVCTAGDDANPADLFDGSPSFSTDLTEVSMPIKGGTTGFDYYITVTSQTTNQKKILDRFGLLPVRG